MAEVYVTGDNTPIAVVGTDGKVSLAISKNCCCKPVQCAIALVYTGKCEETCGSDSAEVSYRDDDGNHSVYIPLPEPSDGSVSYVVVSTRGALHRFSVDSRIDLGFEVGSFLNTQEGDPYSIREKAGTDKCAYYAEIKPKYFVIRLDYTLRAEGFFGKGLPDCLHRLVEAGRIPYQITAKVREYNGEFGIDLLREENYDASYVRYHGVKAVCANRFVANEDPPVYFVPQSATIPLLDLQKCSGEEYDELQLNVSSGGPATTDCSSFGTLYGDYTDDIEAKYLEFYTDNVCSSSTLAGVIRFDPGPGRYEDVCDVKQDVHGFTLLVLGMDSPLPVVSTDDIAYSPVSARYGRLLGLTYQEYDPDSSEYVACDPSGKTACSRCGDYVKVAVFEPKYDVPASFVFDYGPCTHGWFRTGGEVDSVEHNVDYESSGPELYGLKVSVCTQENGAGGQGAQSTVCFDDVELVVDGNGCVDYEWVPKTWGDMLYKHVRYKERSGPDISVPACSAESTTSVRLVGAWLNSPDQWGNPGEGDYVDAEYLLSNGMADSDYATVSFSEDGDGNPVRAYVRFSKGVDRNVPEPGVISVCKTGPSDEEGEDDCSVSWAKGMSIDFYSYVVCRSDGGGIAPGHPIAGSNSPHPSSYPEIRVLDCDTCGSQRTEVNGWLRLGAGPRFPLSKIVTESVYGGWCLDFSRYPVRTLFAVRMPYPFHRPCGSSPVYLGFDVQVYDAEGTSIALSFSTIEEPAVQCPYAQGCVWFGAYAEVPRISGSAYNVSYDSDLFSSFSTFGMIHGPDGPDGECIFVADAEWRCVPARLEVGFRFSDEAWERVLGISDGVVLDGTFSMPEGCANVAAGTWPIMERGQIDAYDACVPGWVVAGQTIYVSGVGLRILRWSDGTVVEGLYAVLDNEAHVSNVDGDTAEVSAVVTVDIAV